MIEDRRSDERIPGRGQHALVLLVALAACRYSLDHFARADAPTGGTCTMGTSASCVASATGTKLTDIQANVFDNNCTFSGCHDGGNTLAGKLDLRDGKSFAHLVNVPSMLEPTRMLVVPGNPAQSYLEVMIGDLMPSEADPPAGPIRADIGLMPMNNGGDLLCCQKLAAIKSWITAGAMQ